MTCPTCGQAGTPKATALDIAICGVCGMTCKIDALGGATVAKIADLRLLSDEQLNQLRHARAPLIERRHR